MHTRTHIHTCIHGHTDTSYTDTLTHTGGNPFDDACSCPWGLLGDQFPSHPIPMACQSATVELRGESDVSLTGEKKIGGGREEYEREKRILEDRKNM